MLINVLRMPHHQSLGVDRKFATSTQNVFPDQIIQPFGSEHLSFATPDVVLGSKLSVLPDKLFKAIYTCPHHRWILEVVYAMDSGGCHCLYVKTIAGDVDVMIPAATIKRLSERGSVAFTLGELLSETYYHTSAPLVFSATVPPIFSHRSLQEEIHRLISSIEERFPYDRLQQLYHHEPTVLEAIIRGKFHTPPHSAIRSSFSYIPSTPSKWFIADEENFHNRVSPGRSFYNHPEFDELALAMIWLRPTELRYSIRMEHALEGNVILGLTSNLQDTYRHALSDIPDYLPRIQHQIATIVRDAVETYCRIFGYDVREFHRSVRAESVVTVEKNIYDEVTVSFKDQVHHKYVRFYTSFATIALGTWGMVRGL